MKKLLFFIAIFSFLICCDGTDYNNPPTLQISADVSSGICPLTVSFSARASDRDGDSLSFEWDFGDGSDYSKEQNPVHVYNSTGNFTALCTVADDGNPPKSATATLQITVQPLKPQIDSISPQSKAQHMPAFTLTITGSNFQTGAEIIFNNVEKATTYVSSTELRCEISTEEITISALQADRFEVEGLGADISIPVVVRNPAPCGTDSEATYFTLYEKHSFKSPVKVVSNIADYPAISYDKSRGNINIISYLNGANLSQSADQGKTWSNKKIADAAIPLNYSIYFVIRTDDSGNINIIWSNLEIDWANWVKIVFIRSENGGNAWSEPNMISHCNTEFEQIPDLVVKSDGRMTMVFKGMDIEYYSYGLYGNDSIDGGLIWTSCRYLTRVIVKIPWDLSLAVDSSDRLHMTVQSGDIYYARDDGQWSNEINISNSNWRRTADPVLLTCGSDNIYLIWRDGDSSSTKYIFFSRSSDGGATWSTPKIIANNSTGIGTISAAVDAVGNINIVLIMNSNMYFIRSIDDGLNWTSPLRITTIDTVMGKHALDVDPQGNLHIAWRDTSADANLYYSTNEF